MRRGGRGKGKKQSVNAKESRGSDDEEEEKISAYRRRGRLEKPVKDEIEEEQEKDDDDNNGLETSKEDVKVNGRKRKRQVESKESNVMGEENGVGSKSSTDDSTSLCIGFRHNGSRRKNKPRRAAEAVVECNGV